MTEAHRKALQHITNIYHIIHENGGAPGQNEDDPIHQQAAPAQQQYYPQEQRVDIDDPIQRQTAPAQHQYDQQE